MRSWIRHSGFAACLLVALTAASQTASGQSLEQRLDSERYLRGLRDLQLPEVIEHYLKAHPPANDIEAALQEIARQHALLSGVEGARREAQVRTLLQVRQDLINEHPADPRRAVWLADQASDIFFELLPSDSLNLTALFGLPDKSQRASAADAAAKMNDAAQQAEQAIDAAIRAIEGAPTFSKDVVLQQRRRQLADIERDRRIPFLRGVAAYLNAELNQSGAEAQKSCELATGTLSPLTDSLEGAPALNARQYDGLAKARLKRYDEAEARFASVAKDPAAAPADVFAARMGGVLNRLVSKGPQSALEGLASIEEKYRDPSLLFFRVLIADQQFRLRLAQAKAAPAAQRASSTAAAFASYTDLLKVPYPPNTVSREALRSIAFSRLTTAASAVGDMPTTDLPPIVAVAQADALSREQATREQAIVSLEGLLKAGSLQADDRASALFALGRALFEADQPLMAAQRFCELARDHPADAQAERSIELAATLAFDEHRNAPNDPETRRVLRETLDLLLAKYANLKSIDRWQYAAGRLALVEGRFDDAAQHFGKVTPNAAEWLDANFMQAATARDKATASSGAGAQPLHQQTRQVVTKVSPIIQLGLSATNDAQRKASLQYYMAMLKVFAAEATLALGEPQKAIDSLAGIENDSTIGADALGEAMRVRINAYQALRKPEEALSDLKRFVESSPKQAGAVLQPMIAALSADVQRLINDGQDAQARDLATRTLLPAAKSLEAWLQTPDAPTDPVERIALERGVADAYRYAGDCDSAGAIYQRLVRVQPDSGDILLGHAECLYSLGGEQHMADAMNIYKRLAASGPGGTGAMKERYWLSQLRMLQILDATGRGTQQILPRIERLRQSDQEFGGERFRQGFEALRAKYAGRGN